MLERKKRTEITQTLLHLFKRTTSRHVLEKSTKKFRSKPYNNKKNGKKKFDNLNYIRN